MTKGEKLVWAAVFAREELQLRDAMRTQIVHAVEAAADAVRQMRKAQKLHRKEPWEVDHNISNEAAAMLDEILEES